MSTQIVPKHWTLDGLAGYLTNPKFVDLDEHLTGGRPVVNKPGSHYLEWTRSNDSTLDHITGLLSLSTLVRAAPDSPGADSHLTLTKIRDSLNQSSQWSSACELPIALLGGEPSLIFGKAVFLAVGSDAGLKSIVLDLALIVELLGWDRTSLTLKYQARGPAKTISNQFHWLFDDSKVPAASSYDSGEAASDLFALFLALADLTRSSEALAQDLKSHLDPLPFSKLASELRNRYRTAALESCSKPCYENLLDVTRCLINLFVTAWDHAKKRFDDHAETLNLPDEAPEAARRLKQILPTSRIDLEGEIRRLQDLSEQLKHKVEELHADKSRDLPLHWIVNVFFKAAALLHEIADILAIESAIEIYNSGVVKLLAKKKTISWSFKVGHGLQGYLDKGFWLPPSNRSLLTNLLRAVAGASEILSPKNQSTRKPKVPKGCLDYNPTQMQLREVIFGRIVKIFKSYGAEPIDTPVFELKETLTGKYGEDTKLIYDLQDQGGEQLALRYDLTVPFARYCASNGVERIKRYHIGKVYRRDEPQVARGRLREFYQCDVDIAGSYDRMHADAEILNMTLHVLSELRPIVGDFRIKLSHRKFLDGMMALCGVPEDKLRAISSAIDKLDKETWETVEHEMVEIKGLSIEAARRLKKMAEISGPFESVTEEIRKVAGAAENTEIKTALEDLGILFDRLSCIPQARESIIFDPSLARGLDYYTGLIYEAVVLDGEVPVGTIAAGGRYDGLVGMFSAGKEIPSIGISFGIERVFRLLDSKFKIDRFSLRSLGESESTTEAALNRADVYISGEGTFNPESKQRISNILRTKGIRCEFTLSDSSKIKREMILAKEQNIPYMVVFEETQLSGRGQVSLRTMDDGSREEVLLDDLASLINAKLKACAKPTIDDLLFANY